jgi:flagellar hook-associated protein 1 FlgK
MQTAADTLSALGFSVTTVTGGFNVSYNGVALVTNGAKTNIQDAVASDITAWVAYNRNNLTLGGTALDIAGGTVTSGQLYSHIEMITSQSASNPGIPYYMDQINTFVKDMAKSLNDINRSGYTYPNGTTDSTNGINLFDVPNTGTAASPVYDYSQVTAGNFTLSTEVLASAYNIAGSSAQVVLGSSSTQTGNNEVALQLFNDLTNSGYYDKLNSIVSNLAIAANTTDSITSTKESLLDSTQTQRQSQSAVSLDEETANLIIFQQSYQACSRIITTLDEMLDTMINNMGTVGR